MIELLLVFILIVSIILLTNLIQSIKKYKLLLSINNELEANIREMKKNFILEKENLKNSIEKTARNDAINRSRSVLRGQVGEQMAPFLIENMNPKDYRFLGNPIDYIIFDGLSDVIDNNNKEIKCIYLLDIKTGSATLSKTQKAIKEAIISGKISFLSYNLDTKKMTEWNTHTKTEKKIHSSED